MIQIYTAKRFKVGEHSYDTLEDAQRETLGELIGKQPGSMEVDMLIKHAEEVVDILTTKENSLPKARRVNGGRKRRVKAADGPVMNCQTMCSAEPAQAH